MSRGKGTGLSWSSWSLET
uniref:Uncharacterized protein n=1 Tax=Arundo donax TaxID=35708 RepID=A0A0A9FN46_ARUDO